jgi:hypothetical protein
VTLTPDDWQPSSSRSRPFAGLGVFFTALATAEPMQLHLALAEHVDPAAVPVVSQVATALGLTEFQAPLASAPIVTGCPPGRSSAEAGPRAEGAAKAEC